MPFASMVSRTLNKMKKENNIEGIKRVGIYIKYLFIIGAILIVIFLSL